MNATHTAKLKLWVAALRSGKYRQGRTALKPSAETYCCLGVACEISGVGNWQDRGRSDNDGLVPGVYYETPAGNYDRMSLPVEVRRFYGLQSDNPSVVVSGFEFTLAELNDIGPCLKPHPEPGVCQHPRTPLTFEQIADLIEQQLIREDA